MAVKMILQGGPLDGEEQLVLDLNTTPGYQMQFDIPNYQTFDESGDNVTGLGLVAVYAYLEPGPGPGSSDTWTSSSIYEFVQEYFVPQPPPLYPPGEGPPLIPLPPVVFMGALSSMTVNANDPSAGVQLVGEGDMTVVGIGTSVDYATVALSAETSLIVTRQSWQNTIAMGASTTMTVTSN